MLNHGTCIVVLFSWPGCINLRPASKRVTLPALSVCPSVYMSWWNAAVLVPAVTIKLTWKQEEGIGEGIRNGGIGKEEIAEGGLEGLCFSLP
jgi:hypothetical protein